MSPEEEEEQDPATAQRAAWEGSEARIIEATTAADEVGWDG